jgi:hypothetical protein
VPVVTPKPSREFEAAVDKYVEGLQRLQAPFPFGENPPFEVWLWIEDIFDDLQLNSSAPELVVQMRADYHQRIRNFPTHDDMALVLAFIGAYEASLARLEMPDES